MVAEQKSRFLIDRRTRRAIRFWSAVFGIAVTSLHPAAVEAQQASTAVYVAGNGVVTAFSGVLPPVQIAPGVDPNQKTFIDPNGPALRVVDLQHMGGPAEAQLVGAPKPFTFTAAQLGQVFGVALDDSEPPNIYAAATSAYGLPIVAPGPDGAPLHIRVGTPNARFMPGLWGPQGGPASIWKIDGVTGAVSLFATVATDGKVNSGAALGGLAYDPDSKSLYVADRESGLIHRFGMNGSARGTYDHGVTGRAAQGLPPAPWTSPQPIDVASPQFDSGEPATWDYAVPARRVFGLVVHERRLFYAVADSLQIWSVGLNPDGSFGDDAAIELAVPPSTGPTEISKITFDEQGRMFLADRPAPTGAYDFEALAVPAIGRVLRYTVVEIMPNGRRVWQQQPDQYAIGFPPDFRNGNGGVAIGYNYDRNGTILAGSCGGFMWTTGEDLRQPSDATLAARLGRSGPLDVNGLQGNGTWRIRRDDAPPQESYFVDYDDEYDDPAERGHLGDIAIERLCSAAQRADLIPFGGAPPVGAPPAAGLPPGVPSTPPTMPPPPPNTPPGGCLPGQLRDASTGACGSCARPGIQINGTCCSATQIAATAACSNSSCPVGQTPIGPSNFCCNSSQVYFGAGGAPACCSGALVNGKCPTPPPPPVTTCTKGYVPIGNSCCLASKVTSTGVCCPAGQAPAGPNKSQCEDIVLIPIKLPPGPQCCASGIPTASGKCCPPANVTTGGVCCSGPVDPANRKECRVLIPLAACAPGYTKMPDGSCCNNRFVGTDGKSCNTGQRPCAPGEFRDEHDACVPMPSHACAPGEFRNVDGSCEPIPSTVCPRGEERNHEGACVTIRTPTCPAGEIRDRDGNCVSGQPPRIGRPAVPPRRIFVPRRPGPFPPPRRPIFRRPIGGEGGLFRR